MIQPSRGSIMQFTFWLSMIDGLVKSLLIVIPAPIFIGINSSRNPKKHWIPPYQVRGRLSQVRNEKIDRTYVVKHKFQIDIISK
jgi:hypothetical protein